MKRVALIVAAVVAAAAVPAWAAKPAYKPPHPGHPSHPSHPAHPTKPSHPSKPSHPAHPTKPTHPTKPSHPKGDKGHKGHQHGHKGCTPINRGYSARGTLASATLTPGTRKHRFDGSLTADITRANHKGTLGSQTFTLTDARVFFGKGVSSTAPAAGDRVKLHGKVTALPHGCSTTGFTPTVTVHSVRIRAPKSH